MKILGPYVRSTDKRAFVVIVNDDKQKTTKLYSRYLLEQSLGRELLSSETVDHINGNPLDDRLENLQILSREDNAKKSAMKLSNIICICPVCSQEFTPTKNQINKRAQNKSGPFCSRKCSGKYSASQRSLTPLVISNTLPSTLEYVSNDGKYLSKFTSSKYSRC